MKFAKLIIAGLTIWLGLDYASPQALARVLRGTSFTVYEGLVASRAREMSNHSTSSFQTQSRSAHIATETLTSIKLAFAGFYSGTNTGGPVTDTGLGAATTITVGIEYPAGTCTQAKFSGSASGTIPDVGVLFSDYTTVSIPSGATFWVRNLRTNANGVFFNAFQNSAAFNGGPLGEATEVATSGLTDKTVSCATITDSGTHWSVPPLAIMGMTTNPSMIIVGDSIAAGTGDVEDTSGTATGYNAKVGTVARSLGNIPFVNIARGFATAQGWTSQAVGSDLIIQKGSHLFIGLGTNDFANSRTPAQLISDIQTIAALAWSHQKIYVCTVPPRSSSTDNWATLVNQTATSKASQNSFNTSVRATLAGTTGFYDVASALESSQNSDLWIAATPQNTIEGVHPEPPPQGYQLVVNAGVISPVTWP